MTQERGHRCQSADFIDANPQYLAKPNMMPWISSNDGETYNGCHYWSNFEIARIDFWRSEAYRAYFKHLDQAGGFFYERWGDGASAGSIPVLSASRRAPQTLAAA